MRVSSENKYIKLFKLLQISFVPMKLFMRVLLACAILSSATILCKSTNYSVVMSAGDSITTGLGARWSYARPTMFVYEDCGVSFATGGDDDTTSIAKLIEEEWDSEVAGKSFGSRRVNLCIDRPANST